MDYLKKTQAYYSKWLAIETNHFNKKKVVFKRTLERDIVPSGYNTCFHLYCYISDHQICVSYSGCLDLEIEQIKTFFKEVTSSPSIEEIKALMKNVFNGNLEHSIKFYYDTIPHNLETANAIQLTENEYSDYLVFFEKQYPDTQTDWVQDYYQALVDKGYCWGAYRDEILVSVTDTPIVPYMNDLIVDLGINTLQNYTHQGHAKTATGALIKHLIDHNKVPIWSCGDYNIASIALAHSLGFKKLADVLTFTIK